MVAVALTVGGSRQIYRMTWRVLGSAFDVACWQCVNPRISSRITQSRWTSGLSAAFDPRISRSADSACRLADYLCLCAAPWALPSVCEPLACIAFCALRPWFLSYSVWLALSTFALWRLIRRSALGLLVLIVRLMLQWVRLTSYAPPGLGSACCAVSPCWPVVAPFRR